MKAFVRTLALILGLWVPWLPLYAQGMPGMPDRQAATSAPDDAQAHTAPEALSSPRATMATFLHAMNDIKRGDPSRIEQALATLDLSAINPLVRAERGAELAWQLLDVLDRTRRVDLDVVPDRNSGPAWVFQRYRTGSVRIARKADGRWLFAADTVAALPAIADELAGTARAVGLASSDYLPWYLRMREDLPSALKRETFLLQNWQWLALLVMVAAGVALDWLVSRLLRLVVRSWRSRSGHAAFAELADDMLRPFGMMAMALLWWSGISLMGLPESALLLLLVAVKFLASAAGVWAAYRLVDLISAWLDHHAGQTENRIDDVLAPLVTRTLKVFITVVGVVFVADNLNIDVTGLLAGLGLGGLAFALAAKDMVQNLFGSVTILLDRTFTVGDWIVIGDHEGTVESIGFRSTRLRTFYNSLVTIPNSRFITADVDNMGERRYRRMKATYGVTYDTPPDKIEAFCEGLRELVRQHPYMRKDYFHIYFNSFGASSLDILVYVFWETPDWATELAERHRFLLDSLRLAHRLGVEFAYPTQTLYLQQGDGGPPASEMLSQAHAFEQGQAAARAVVGREAADAR